MEKNDQLPIRVIKIGGSLFRHQDLISIFMAWYRDQPKAINMILAGGGELADVIRAYDQRHGLGEEAAHWIAIETMKANALVIAHQFKLSDLQKLDPSRIHYNEACKPVLLDPVWFMKEVDFRQSAHPLPSDWEITSDSIAARVAETYHASELVLLKSCLPQESDWKRWGEEDYVDPAFVKHCPKQIELRCVSLRDATFPELKIDLDSNQTNINKLLK